jgi:hypothetical protein
VDAEVCAYSLVQQSAISNNKSFIRNPINIVSSALKGIKTFKTWGYVVAYRPCLTIFQQNLFFRRV